MSKHARRMIRPVLTLILAAVCQPGHAAQPPSKADSTRVLTIPAGTLIDALDRLGDQSGVRIMFETALVKDIRVQALSGTYSVRAALTQLLMNTGLEVDSINEKTVVLKRAVPTASEPTPANQMRMAAAEDAGNAARSASSADPSDQVTVEGVRDRPAPFSTPNLDLTRTADDVLPFQVFTAEEIQRSGAVDLREFLQKRLPQNFTDNNANLLDGAGANALNDPIELRGWGSRETLLLLNGRRMGAENQGVNDDTGLKLASLRAIPMGSIERIEILSSAAGAIYGASATGGVINIITRQDYSGGQASLGYETPMDANRPQRTLGLSYGLPLARGLSARLTASFSDSEPARVGERSEMSIARWRQFALERDPSRLAAPVGGNPLITSSQPIYGATPNIRTVSTSGTANLFTGSTPGSNFTAVPAGYTGPDSSTPNRAAAFTRGRYNTALAEGAGSPYALDALTGAREEDASFGGGVDWNFGREWRLSVDYDYRASRSRGAPPTGLLFSASSATDSRPRVPTAAPGNPFGQNVHVALIDSNLYRAELGQRQENTTWTLSSTLRGQIGQWRGFLDLSTSANESQGKQAVFYEPVGGWTAAFTSGAYNPFVDTRVRAPASGAFYDNYVQQRVITANETTTDGAMLKASGPLFSLPAGAIQLTAGLQWQHTERGKSDYQMSFLNAATGAAVTPQSGSSQLQIAQETFGFANARRAAEDSQAVYAEAVIPLLSAAQSIPLVRRLEMFASGRVDRLENTGFPGSDTVSSIRNVYASLAPLLGVPQAVFEAQFPRTTSLPEGSYRTETTLYTVGLRHEMLEGLQWRISRSEGVQPPFITQINPYDASAVMVRMLALLFPPQPTPLYDPRRQVNFGYSATTMSITGGNPDVQPERSQSTNVGVIFQPRAIKGLRLSLDYIENLRDNAIVALTAAQALALEAEIPELVQRAPASGGAVGAVTMLDLRYRNLSRQSSRSLDIALEQEIGAVMGGRLFLNLAATRNLSFKVQTGATSPAQEQVRLAAASAFSNRQIAWNGNAQVNWAGPRWGMGWSTRYFDYLLVNPAFVALQGSDRAPRAFEHDLNLDYRVPDRTGAAGWQDALSGTRFTLVVKNVFDRAPRFWAQGLDSGVAPYDAGALRGRTLSLQVSKNFSH